MKQSANDAGQDPDAAPSVATKTTKVDGEDEDMTEMMNSVSVRDSSPSPQPTTGSSGSGSDGETDMVARSSTATSLPVPIVPSSIASNNNTLPDSIMARSATPTSTTQFALAAGVLHDGGPNTPMNDIGPFVFDGGAGRGSRPVDDMARGAVREEAEER